MKKMVLSILLGLATLSAGEITIAVAANVSYAIEALKKEFKAIHPETDVQVILGSSGKLTAQIRHGAPYG
ncbi:MAG TPA: substrate-binding domain-containing protein, partial [Sulfurovum sp.]|uniref:substrate-binding domain-containing protein n=1 Tax=Sulfurovum sp. TaxID=1969726 RepID=UPI002F93459C